MPLIILILTLAFSIQSPVATTAHASLLAYQLHYCDIIHTCYRGGSRTSTKGGAKVNNRVRKYLTTPTILLRTARKVNGTQRFQPINRFLAKFCSQIPYSRKYWRELNLAVGPQIAICKNIGGFKFGCSVRDRHKYICKYEILADFNLAVERQTAKPPNLIPHQIFRLYDKSDQDFLAVGRVLKPNVY